MVDEEENYVEITDENGEIIKCEIYDVVEFEEKTYALLMPLEESTEEDSDVIVFEYIEEGEDCYFKNIEDDEEFDRVCEYIQSLEDEEDFEDDDEEEE